MQPAGVLLQFSRHVKVPMSVRRPARHMRMRMPVEAELVFPGEVEHAGTKRHEHRGDAQLESAAQAIGHGDLKQDDGASGYGEGEGMAGPPEEADPAASEQAFFPADECCDGDNVIRVSGMLQTKKEAQTQNSG